MRVLRGQNGNPMMSTKTCAVQFDRNGKVNILGDITIDSRTDTLYRHSDALVVATHGLNRPVVIHWLKDGAPSFTTTQLSYDPSVRAWSIGS